MPSFDDDDMFWESPFLGVKKASAEWFLIGAFFFLVPGAITDLIGICLIIPQLRRFIIGIMVNKIIFEMRKRESRS